MYTPKNILITGGAGFIGRAVANYLVEHYLYNVIVVDILDYCASLVHLDKRVLFIRGDICNKDFMNDIVYMYDIDTIMHFAAQTHVDNSFDSSLQFTYTNVYGTHVMAEVAIKNNVKRFIHVRTDEVYGEQSIEDITGCKEDATLNPTNPYAATKCGAEFIIKSYQKSYNLPAIITRSNNVYGGGQYPEKVIPKFVMTLLNNKDDELPLHGDGNTYRNFIYIDDEVDCFDKILHYGEVNSIYNISGHKEVSMKELGEIIARYFHVEPKFKHLPDRNFNDKRYCTDCASLINLYSSCGALMQITPFEEGIAKTIQWYDKYGKTSWPELRK